MLIRVSTLPASSITSMRFAARGMNNPSLRATTSHSSAAPVLVITDTSPGFIRPCASLYQKTRVRVEDCLLAPRRFCVCANGGDGPVNFTTQSYHRPNDVGPGQTVNVDAVLQLPRDPAGPAQVIEAGQ